MAESVWQQGHIIWWNIQIHANPTWVLDQLKHPVDSKEVIINNSGPSLRSPETFFIFILPSSASTSRTLKPVSRMVAFFALDFLKTVPMRPLPMLGVLGRRWQRERMSSLSLCKLYNELVREKRAGCRCGENKGGIDTENVDRRPEPRYRCCI